MRVGLVAKGLLLKGDMDLELVLLCSQKPTVTLLKQVAESLSAQIKVGPTGLPVLGETDSIISIVYCRGKTRTINTVRGL